MVFNNMLTAPREHDPENFVYVVHALANYADVDKSIEKVLSFDKYYSASLVGKLDEVSAKGYTFGFGSDVKQFATYSNFGLIVEPQDDLIQIAWNSDLGTPRDAEMLKKYVNEHKGKKKHPLTLLSNCMGSFPKYNELVIKGHPLVNISGLFYKEYGESNVKLLKDKISKKTGKDLPVIYLPNPVREKLSPEERSAKIMQESAEAMQSMHEFHNAYTDHGSEFYDLKGTEALAGISLKDLKALMR